MKRFAYSSKKDFFGCDENEGWDSDELSISTTF